MREALGVRRVEREDVAWWRGSEVACSELVGLAVEMLNDQLGTSLRAEASPFVMVGVADFAVFVAQGWTGEITPAVLLKGASLDSAEIFSVGN